MDKKLSLLKINSLIDTSVCLNCRKPITYDVMKSRFCLDCNLKFGNQIKRFEYEFTKKIRKQFKEWIENLIDDCNNKIITTMDLFVEYLSKIHKRL